MQPLFGIPGAIELADGRLIFGDPATNELKVTDGTFSGTEVLGVVSPYHFPAGPVFTRVGAEIWFIGFDSAHGNELWRTDGTPQGTSLLVDLEPGPATFLTGGAIASAGGVTYLFRAGGPNPGLWRTDGTGGGTTLIQGFNPSLGTGFRTFQGVEVGGKLIFLLSGFIGDSGLWVTDGTTGGTQLLAALPLDEPIIPQLAAGQTRAFVTRIVSDFSQPGELLSTDGTLAGTVSTQTPVVIQRSGVAGDRFVFGNSGETRSWDGVSPTTVALPALGSADFTLMRSRGGLVTWNSILGYGPGARLFQSDGTPAGTQALPGFNGLEQQVALFGLAPTGPVRLFIEQFALDPSELNLVGYDAATDSWRPLDRLLQGKAKSSTLFAIRRLLGKAMIGQLIGGPITALYTSEGDLTGTQVFFNNQATTSPVVLARQPVVDLGGRALTITGEQILATDGTLTGSQLIGVGGALSLARIGQQVLASTANSGDLGPTSQLWSTDGSVLGTAPLLPLNEPAIFGDLVPFRDGVVFNGSPQFQNPEPWFSDGTSGGTAGFVELGPGGLGSAPFGFTVAGELVYFSARDYTLAPAAIQRVHVSDGTAAGTRVLLDPNGQPFDLIRVETFEPFGDRMAFAISDGAGAEDLWITDGTQSGTQRLADFGSLGGRLFLESAGERLFVSQRIDGTELFDLWTTDGTANGTNFVTRVLSDPLDALGALPLRSLELQDRVLFAARDSAGLEYWVSDGTAAGTRRVADLYEGPGSALNNFLIDQSLRSGERLFLEAESPEFGREPLSLPLSVAGGWAKLHLGESCAGTLGAPRIDAVGDGTTGGSLEICVENAFPGGLSAVFVGSDFVLPLGPGLCSAQVSAPAWLGPALVVDGQGVARLPVSIPNQPALVDQAIYLQAICLEPNGPFGGFATLTSALELAIGE